MDRIICRIDFSRGQKDNYYDFYENGKIEHNYDNNIYNDFNNHKILESNQISDERKAKLIEKCPPEFLERITQILYPKEIPSSIG